MKKRKEKKPSNKLVTVVMILLVVIICFVVNFRSRDIKAQNEAAKKEIERLNSQIEDEKNRTEDLEEYKKYTTTKQFVEEYARKYLGLIYPDELIFEPEE